MHLAFGTSGKYRGPFRGVPLKGYGDYVGMQGSTGIQVLMDSGFRV